MINYLQILNDLEKNSDNNMEKRIVLVDGMNLFFRCFSVINSINHSGEHIGGLAGFLKSLGSYVKKFNPTDIYVIFDGEGSSTNRKNIIPEYKSGRNSHRMTNGDIFENINDEKNSQLTQIGRLIQYLHTLPVKVISIEGLEADDIISYLSQIIPVNIDDKVFIVSSDKDYIQLINRNVILYRPMEKMFYTPNHVKETYLIPAQNFIIYKTLTSDPSDKINGIRGLGFKKLIKLFPELKDNILSLDDIYDICKQKYKENIYYSKIIHEFDRLKDNFKVMDLKDPMMKDTDKTIIENFHKENKPSLDIPTFCFYHKTDGLEKIIPLPEKWLNDTFSIIN
jgi:DNA polymerase-1